VLSNETELTVDQLVAAYRVGALLNQLDWHMQQAWIIRTSSGARKHDERACEAFVALGTMVRWSVALKQRDGLQAFVVEKSRCWKKGFNSGCHREEHAEAIKELWNELDRADGMDGDVIRTQVCQTLLRFVTDLHKQVRTTITEALEDFGKLALGLGECVDRGVRPAGIYQFLYSPPRPKPVVLHKGESLWSIPAAGSPIDRHAEEPENYLGNRTYRARGPETGWHEDLTQRWAELGLPTKLIQTLLNYKARKSAHLLKDIDQLAEQQLTKLHFRQVSDRGPRLSIANTTQSVTLDGEQYSIKDPAAFQIFKAIAKAKGEIITSEEFRHLPACKGRVDRKIQTLPAALQKVISRKGGPGGGYWLKLLEKKSPRLAIMET
jgi:hypothetical protein